jgi:hypothetical protein
MGPQSLPKPYGEEKYLAPAKNRTSTPPPQTTTVAGWYTHCSIPAFGHYNYTVFWRPDQRTSWNLML